MGQSSLWLDRSRLEQALVSAGAGRKSGVASEGASLRHFGLDHKTPVRPPPITARPQPPTMEGALKNRLADFIEWLLMASDASCAYVLDADGIATVSRHREQRSDERVLPVATALLDTLRLVRGPLREDGVNHAAVSLPGCGTVEVVSSSTNLGQCFAAWATQAVMDPTIARQAAWALRSAINGRQGE